MYQCIAIEIRLVFIHLDNHCPGMVHQVSGVGRHGAKAHKAVAVRRRHQHNTIVNLQPRHVASLLAEMVGRIGAVALNRLAGAPA